MGDRTPFRLQFRDYRTLYQVARRRNNSPEDYFAFEEFQGRLLVKFLKSQAALFDGCVTLDLGCGLGGYTSALQKGGAKVVGLDFVPAHNLMQIPFVSADALQLPFSSEQFDLIVCASLIEHVPDPSALLLEIFRVLKRDGIVYLSYPPYYSPVGGHQFSPFHLLGERFALWVACQRGLFRGHKWLQEKFPVNPSSFDNAYETWGLHKLTIAKIKKEIRKMPVEILECSTRWLPIDFSRVPVLGELLTWHVQFLLRKK